MHNVPSKEDRDSMAALHTSGTQVDAVWHRIPTVINKPTTTTFVGTTPGSSANASESHRKPYTRQSHNPFSHGRMSSNINSSRAEGPSRPRKQRIVEEWALSGFRSGSETRQQRKTKSPSRKGKGKVEAKSRERIANDEILIEDSDSPLQALETMQLPIPIRSSSVDELDCISASASAHEDSHDGPNTTSLRRRVGACPPQEFAAYSGDSDDDSDVQEVAGPSNPFHSTPVHPLPLVPQASVRGRPDVIPIPMASTSVKSLRQRFEPKKGSPASSSKAAPETKIHPNSTLPHIDFNKAEFKPKMVEKMNKKSAQSITNKPRKASNGKAPQRARARMSNHVRVKAWYPNNEDISDSGSYYLSTDQRIIYLRRQDEDGKVYTPVMQFDLTEDVSKIDATKCDVEVDLFIVAIHLNNSLSSDALCCFGIPFSLQEQYKAFSEQLNDKCRCNWIDCHATKSLSGMLTRKPPSIGTKRPRFEMSAPLEQDDNVPFSHKQRAKRSKKTEQSNLSEHMLEVSRRRSSRLANADSALAAPVDNDELILVYPSTAVGAVNITKGDLRRLQPNEFLNDSLIEFGLKHWLRNLEENKPEMAGDVHVFSSFFYNRVNKKNHDEGYQSVRKWTSKFDLFQKKYIIVPINESYHWYLAIICLPEKTLLSRLPNPPPPPPPLTRKRPRAVALNASDATSVPSAITEATASKPTALSYSLPPILDLPSSASSSETMEVESALLGNLSLKDCPEMRAPMLTHELIDVDSSPKQEIDRGEAYMAENMLVDTDLNSIVIDGSPSAISGPLPSTTTRGDMSIAMNGSSDGAMHIDIIESHFDNCRERSRTNDEQEGRARSGGEREKSAEVLDLDESDSGGSLSNENERATHQQGITEIRRHSVSTLPSRSISAEAPNSLHSAQSKPVNFYGKNNQPKVRHSEPISRPLYDREPEPVVIESDHSQEGAGGGNSNTEVPVAVDEDVTWIFTLDSMGSSHPQAINVLRDYLKLEARDKKQNESPREAKGKKMRVPLQPNYSDCGLYLLHCVHRFMEDPKRFLELAFTSTKALKKEDVDSAWNVNIVQDSRSQMAKTIGELSAIWIKEKEEKEAKKGQGDAGPAQEEADSDIEFVN